MKNKYNAKTIYFCSKYNLVGEHVYFKNIPGYEKFDSKFELKIYQTIFKYTKKVERQVRLKLFESVIVLDFAVCILNKYNIKEKIYIEAKGYETNVWKLKQKQFLALYPTATLFVIRNNTDILNLEKYLSQQLFCNYTDV